MEDVMQFDNKGSTIAIKTIPAKEGGSHKSICACRTFRDFHTAHDDTVAWMRELAEFLIVSAGQLERMPKIDLCTDLTPYLSGRDAANYRKLKQRLANMPDNTVSKKRKK